MIQIRKTSVSLKGNLVVLDPKEVITRGEISGEHQ